MATASIGVLWRLQEAVRSSILAGCLSVALLDRAVLHPFANPVLQVTVEFTSRDAALSTVNLSLDPHLLGGILPCLTLMSMEERACTTPCPLPVVGTRVTTGQGNSSVKSSVNFVEIRVGNTKADAVDGVKEVEDGVV